MALQGQIQGQKQGQVAKGGHAAQQQKQNATAAIETGAVSVQQSDDDNVNISNTTEYKRNAPPVTVVPSPSTAEMMVCFGIGGSGTEGAATGAWCRLQKELYAGHRAKIYASMGGYQRAADTWCERKIHWRDFGSRAACESEMYQFYLNASLPDAEPEPKDCSDTEEKLRRCETVHIK